MMQFADAAPAQINDTLEAAHHAGLQYAMLPLAQRAAFMQAIADGLENSGDGLLHTTMAETNLPEARLRGERARTVFQLRSYAAACLAGHWLDARIDLANANKVPPAPDIRKMLVPLGPVVVFGSSNFPFAYSTAGGDTASAFAAGCAVVVKAHPGHPETSEKVAAIIQQAAANCGMPQGIFGHLHGAPFEVGQALVKHPRTMAVGFTGSLAGGRALFDLANQRPEPIPVFAEMGSVNPVYLLPQKLEQDAETIAVSYAASITLGVGQFCTNPGILVGIAGTDLDRFANALANEIGKIPAGAMLHGGIVKAFYEKRAAALAQQGITLLASGQQATADNQALATIATVSGATFLANPLLHHEVFGPWSLLVQCADADEMLQVATRMEGQLTSTLMATEADLAALPALRRAVAQKCGRLILNGVPTGVEVCHSMHHGGPYPSSTDSRFTSVGADAIRRFARPLCYQNWPDHLLPPELQNANPLGIVRFVNGEPTREPITL